MPCARSDEKPGRETEMPTEIFIPKKATPAFAKPSTSAKLTTLGEKEES